MKQLRGFASNFNDSVVGKVTKKRKGIINRKDYIPIINDSIKYPFGYAGIIKISPKSKSPSYEKLVGDLSGAYSRRINIQHRLIYQILEKEYNWKKIANDYITILKKVKTQL